MTASWRDERVLAAVNDLGPKVGDWMHVDDVAIAVQLGRRETERALVRLAGRGELESMPNPDPHAGAWMIQRWNAHGGRRIPTHLFRVPGGVYAVGVTSTAQDWSPDPGSG